MRWLRWWWLCAIIVFGDANCVWGLCQSGSWHWFIHREEDLPRCQDFFCMEKKMIEFFGPEKKMPRFLLGWKKDANSIKQIQSCNVFCSVLSSPVKWSESRKKLAKKCIFGLDEDTRWIFETYLCRQYGVKLVEKKEMRRRRRGASQGWGKAWGGKGG